VDNFFMSFCCMVLSGNIVLTNTTVCHCYTWLCCVQMKTLLEKHFWMKRNESYWKRYFT